MNYDAVEQALIDVLSDSQRDGGYQEPVIEPSTCPLEDLPGFDSKVAPAATSDLARKLGVSIPNDENIFVDSSGGRRLTVREIALRVQRIAEAAA